MQMRNLLTLLAASVASAQRTGMPPPATNGTITTTIVVNSFVTYCPVPTVITWKDVCYTAKTPGPVTITNCPCTITTVSPHILFVCVYLCGCRYIHVLYTSTHTHMSHTYTLLTTQTQTVPKVTVGPPPVHTKEGIPPPPPPPKGDYPPPPPPPPAKDNSPMAPPPGPPAPPPPPPAAPMPAPPQGGQQTAAPQPAAPKPTYVTAGAAGLRASAIVLAGALAGVVAL